MNWNPNNDLWETYLNYSAFNLLPIDLYIYNYHHGIIAELEVVV